MVDCDVLVTCYNKEEYLDECIASILRQTKEPRSIIVVHDGCDNPMHHAKVTSIFLKENGGVANARHQAFRFSTSKLILFVDGDDVLSPDYLEKMILVLSKGADIAYPDLYLWADIGSRLTTTPKKITKAWVKNINKVVIPVTSLMRREVYEKLEGFKKMVVLEDLDFFVRALCNGYTFRKAETLLWYRRYPATRNSIDINIRKAVLETIMKQLK